MLASNTWLGMNELDEFYLQKLPYYLLFHNGQILLGPFLNTLTQITEHVFPHILAKTGQF